MRDYVKVLVNIVINCHFKFEHNDSNVNQNVCQKVKNDILTKLLDLCDREWNYVGHEEQFMFLKKQLFHKLIDIVTQINWELLEIINYISWLTFSCSKSGIHKPLRNFSVKQPRQASIASLSQKVN